MNTNIVLGADLGMGAIKLHGAGGGLQFLSQTSIAGDSEIKGGMFGLKSRERPLLVSGEFGRFYAGKDSHDFGTPVENIDFDRLTGTPEMLALWYGALTRYQQQFGKFEHPLALVIGLPFQMMQGDEADEYQRAVKKWMKGHHEWIADGVPYAIDVEKTPTAPQAMGAVFDFAFDEYGNPISGREDALHEETGTVSIGFNTTELFVTKKGGGYRERFIGGENVGVRWLLGQLKRKRYKSFGELDNELRSGDLDTSILMEQWWSAVESFITERWGRSHEDFNKVFLVGGGAILLKNQLTKKFKKNNWFAKDAVMVIARGLYKAGLVKR